MAKILIYAMFYTPELTGIGKFAGEMGAWLAARGHKVDAIVPFPYYPMWQIDDNYADKGFHQESIEGVRVLRTPLFVPPPNRVSAVGRIRHELSFCRNSLFYWLPIWSGHRRYDAVIAIGPPSEIAAWPWLYSTLRNVPWVFHVQDLQVDVAVRLGMLRRGPLTKMLHGIENFFLRSASRVTTITEPMRQKIISKRVPEEKVWLFPNWADLDMMQPLSRTTSFRREHGITEDQVLFMYAGNMGEKQGLDLIIQAADHLRLEVKAQFMMIGAGAARHRLEAMVKDLELNNIMFLPLQPAEDLQEVLASADVHLVVQKREAADLVMPSKLLNILAAGRPSVATADPSTALYELLAQHHAGLVSPPGELQPFVEHLKVFLQDSSLGPELGRNARAYAERFLGKDVILTDFETSLLTLVGSGARDR